MKTRRKKTSIAPPTRKPRRHATEREAFTFGAEVYAENPDWLVGAD